MAEFLPLCDVLFNVISLAGYFCDVVFDVVFCYALLERGLTTCFTVVIILILFSLIISQIVSIRWYLNKTKTQSMSCVEGSATIDSIDKHKQINHKSAHDDESKIVRYCVIGLHFSQMGVLWRYAKLFVPVDLRHVKNEVRDLCMLRLVHAFCEAAPMLLLQLHVLVTMQNDSLLVASPEVKLKSLGSHSGTTLVLQPPTVNQEHQLRTFKELNIVSAVLSLFSVCWALASFSKNVRLQNVHRLVLTWLGVIFQFLWRVGTIVSRITSLCVYASVYGYWIFLVLVLHWISMFLWLISPKNVFHGERISRVRKAILAWLIAFVYIFAYINLQEVNHRQKMVTFYVVMFMENCLLVCLWIAGVWMDKPDGWYIVPILVFFSFFIGMTFMLLYYRYFHVRRLRYEAGGRFTTENTNKHNGQISNDNGRTIKQIANSASGVECSNYTSHPIPGVFNCRFTNSVGNGATKRKKKKPTTFIPPPTLTLSAQHDADKEIFPFWRRQVVPRSHTGGSSENEGSAGSRVNIHQKLQEKKQKQLAELKIIEEEIKQGKLGGPVPTVIESGEDSRASLPRQPIPRVKKHINVEPIEWTPSSPGLSSNSKTFNDLNTFSSSNIDDVNNINKYSSKYGPLYNNFGLNGINIPALPKDTFVEIDNAAANNLCHSPAQMTGPDSSLMMLPIIPRSKMHIRNAYIEPYRENFTNVYTDTTNIRLPSISPKNVSTSPNRMMSQYPYHSDLYSYLELNHPRQISGTYSNCIDNTGLENLPFPYNVIPPPKSKLDSRHTPVTPSASIAAHKSSVPGGEHGCRQSQHVQGQIQRAKTPEILLAPHYLDNSRVYYDWVARESSLANRSGHSEFMHQQPASSGDENLDERNGGPILDRHRAPSDIDSQVSLPRSYTLPREFKYYGRNKSRKIIKSEHFITSTNSSDGDVDSGDDNESERHSNQSNQQINNTSQRNVRLPVTNRTNYHSFIPPVMQTATNKVNNIHNSPGTAAVATPSMVANENRKSNQSPNTTNYFHINSSNLLSHPEFVNNGDGIVNGGNSNNMHNSGSGGASNVLNRQIRLRSYVNGKSGIRHETKL